MSALEDRARQVLDIMIGMKRHLNADLSMQVDYEDLIGRRRIVMVPGGVPVLPAAVELARQQQATVVAVMADAYVRDVPADEYVQHEHGEMERNFPRDPSVSEALVVTVMDASTLESTVITSTYGRNDDGSYHFDEPVVGDSFGGRVTEMLKEGLR